MPPVAFIASVLALSVVFLAVGSFAARGIAGGGDYALAGRRSTIKGASGVLLGALIGGASTVGTAEMAYRQGLSAWWFTLGGGIGCLVLGLFLAGPVRRSGLVTIPQFLTQRYGRATGVTVLVGSAMGAFLSVAAQFLAGAALIRSLFPIPDAAAVLLVAALILGFMLVGGLKSFAAVGSAKVLLLVFVLIACAAMVLKLGGGPGFLWRSLPHEPFFDLFGQGWNDVSEGLSLVVGVLSTQIYLQAIFAASSEQVARRASIISSVLMPALGLVAVWVGMSLRASGVAIDPASALPYFVQTNFPPAVAGVFWGSLMITAVGTAAGLTLGIATNLVCDLRAPGSKGAEMRSPWPIRGVVVALVAAAAAVAWRGADTPILQWSYLSMGLRGAGTFFPFLLAGVWPGALPPRFALAASVTGPVVVLLWSVLIGQGEPLFAGLGASGAITVAGIVVQRRRTAVA